MKNWILFIGTAVAAFLLALLAVTIFERKSEAKFAYQPKVALEGIEPRDSVWGLNYPRQYQSYLKTQDTTFRSMYGTSGHHDMLESDPELVILWAGYGFSKDYNAPRGHAYAVEDIHKTLRVGSPTKAGEGPQPSTCWTCKSTDVPRLMSEMGVAEYYSQKFSDLGTQVINPIGCADCHNPETMKLTITRPALIEAFEAMGKDINKASHQEMRSLVCAQCHVEYYFDKKKPGLENASYLTFPWKDGMDVDHVESYYDKADFSDWTHPLSKTPMLKAQHPDYEIYQMGVHAKRGVSCADCHMPYQTEGGQKFTNHHIGSPLANVENSCFVCHREKVDDLVTDVYERQRKIKAGTQSLQKLIAMAHIEAAKAWELGATEAQMAGIQKGIRHAQWRWDYSVASHGAAFHAPLETSRIVTSATELIQNARLDLARLLASLGYNQPVPMPDLTSKSALQAYIGLDIPAEKTAKANYLQEIVPKWLKEGKEREKQKPIQTISSN
ncbi:MAG: ammonia-forming cytochrome c nitrite reductase [Algoriphagus aquaeductus]|jgi:nitrite reductase (cytochrome c-552)|uniref:nitrite reductase (cytochrome; ammonia-forming) n=1 Tax=Algoriphagus aquaeductus TaxID=475299 RepID=A0A326RW62_9BACT|nr:MULTISPECIES: ammonia-forming cytochrome c nitrite reductase [Algoriphagus]PZV85440.1 nitrite reductase (cytochrome c-552) [Algoriphagus aquaeductus]